ncbi:hypothetical protein [Cohnella sp.]|uniref:hypothetical protein n=1 Tax=Cohnella sp. TaxID=1883426 RepID=UPI003567A78B
MLKVWEIDYKGHTIRVENRWFGGEKLYVDGELQDEQVGFDLRVRLYGRIKTGEGSNEIIKVSIGGWVTACCRIFINDALILSKGKY